MILDGVLSFSRDDNDVLNPGNDALFDNVLNLRLVHDGQHFFGLGFGRRQKSRAEPGGRQNRFAHFACSGTLSLRGIGHSAPRTIYFFFVDFFSLVSVEPDSLASPLLLTVSVDGAAGFSESPPLVFFA